MKAKKKISKPIINESNNQYAIMKKSKRKWHESKILSAPHRAAAEEMAKIESGMKQRHRRENMAIKKRRNRRNRSASNNGNNVARKYGNIENGMALKRWRNRKAMAYVASMKEA
jgi:hypothetical protein